VNKNIIENIFKNIKQNNILLETIEIKSLYKYLNENLNNSLLENLKVAKNIEAVLKDFGFTLPKDFKGIKAIDYSDSEKHFNVTDDRNRTQPNNMGKILKQIFPKLNDKSQDKILNYILGDIKAKNKKSKVKFKIHKDVTKQYSKCLADSCMKYESELIKVYDIEKDINILVLYDEKNVSVGRALLWSNTSKGTFMDRIYPAEHDTIISLFNEYADKKKWVRRTSNTAGNQNTTKGNISYKFKNWDKIEYMPYMDTFVSGFEETGIITNSYKNKPDYDFEQVKGTKLHIFKGGDWREGEWDQDYDFMKGTWHDGLFDSSYSVKKATWKNGTFDGAEFSESKWERGIFKDGIFIESIWKHGTFKGGEFRESEWRNGTFEFGEMRGSNWHDGVFYNGDFNFSSWYAGDFKGGDFNNSEWKSGNWFDNGRTRWGRGNNIWSKKFRKWVASPINPIKFAEYEEEAGDLEELYDVLKRYK